jgi:hypothetical protein
VLPGVRTFPVARLGVAAVVAMGLVVLVDAATGLFPLAGRSMTRDGAFLVEIVLFAAYAAAYLLAGTLFLVWLTRAHRNLSAFPGAGSRFDVGWVIAVWFIPLLNLVLPPAVVSPIAHQSLYRSRVTPLLAVWWIPFVVAGCITNFGGALLSGVFDNPAADHAHHYSSGVGGNVIATALLATSAVALSVLVGRVSRAQEDRIARGAPTPVPSP